MIRKKGKRTKAVVATWPGEHGVGIRGWVQVVVRGTVRGEDRARRTNYEAERAVLVLDSVLAVERARAHRGRWGRVWPGRVQTARMC